MKSKGKPMIRAFQPKNLPAVMDLWREGNLSAHCFIPPEYWTDRAGLVRDMPPRTELTMIWSSTHV